MSPDAERDSGESLLSISLLLTYLGLLAYSLARFMLDGYLAPFKLSYDDLGLDYTDIIACGAVACALAIPIAVPVAYAASVLWRRSGVPFFEKYRRVVGAALWIFVVQLVITMGLFLLCWGSVFWWFPLSPLGSGPRAIVGWILLIIPPVVTFGIWMDSLNFFRTVGREISRRRTQTDAPSQSGLMVRALGGAVVGGLFLVACCTAAHLYGSAQARQVQNGKRVDKNFLGVHLPGIEARPVLVRPTGAPGNAPVPVTRCVLLMGQKDGVVVVYQPSSGSKPSSGSVLFLSSVTFSMIDDLGVEECKTG